MQVTLDGMHDKNKHMAHNMHNLFATGPSQALSFFAQNFYSIVDVWKAFFLNWVQEATWHELAPDASHI